MKNSSILSLLFSAIILISSCKKEVVEGPEGPKGEKGESGLSGIWEQTIQINQWSWDSTNLWYQAIPYAYTDLENNAVVLVYYAQIAGNDTAYTPLPYTFNIVSGVTQSTSFVHQSSFVAYRISRSNGTQWNIGSRLFRLVVIPKQWQMGNPDVNWNDTQFMYEKFKPQKSASPKSE